MKALKAVEKCTLQRQGLFKAQVKLFCTSLLLILRNGQSRVNLGFNGVNLTNLFPTTSFSVKITRSSIKERKLRFRIIHCGEIWTSYKGPCKPKTRIPTTKPRLALVLNRLSSAVKIRNNNLGIKVLLRIKIEIWILFVQNRQSSRKVASDKVYLALYNKHKHNCRS